jgi:AraC-like DNA-binding protein
MDKRDNYLYYWNMNEKTFHINRLARFHCAPDWSWETAGQSEWTGNAIKPVRFKFNLWTVLQGTGTLKTPVRTYDLKGGDCFILHGDEHYIVTHNPRDPLTVFAVHFDYLDIKSCSRVAWNTLRYRRIEHMEFFTHMLERMETAWREDAADAAEFWFRACLMEFDRQDREDSYHGLKQEQSGRIEAICRDIRNNPAADRTVDALAKQLHCTSHHFARLFKMFKGCSPQVFIINTRIEAAKGLLHSSNYTIGRIAEIIGYRDIYYFSRQFKHKTGMSPSEYRENG